MKNKIGDVSNTFVSSLIETGETLGLNRAALLEKLSLSESSLTEQGRRLSLVQLMKAGYEIIQMTGEPALGLISGRNSVITALGYPGLLAMSADTVGEALAQLCFFECLTSRCHRGQSKLLIHEGVGTLSFYSIAPYNTYNIFVVDKAVAGWHSLLGWLTGIEDLVASVHFEFPAPGYLSVYDTLFNCPVYFGASENSIRLKKGALDTPVIYRDSNLFQSLQAQCFQQMELLSQKFSMGHKVQNAIGPLLHDGSLTIEDVSKHLQLPSWTIRRRLSEEGLSFQMILDETRKDIAINYVKQPSLSLGEIAFKMGFSNTSAFQRAFKRWTGLAPGQFRNKKFPS